MEERRLITSKFPHISELTCETLGLMDDMQQAPADSGSGIAAAAKQFASTGTKKLRAVGMKPVDVNIAWAVLVCAGLAMIPSAMGVAQYTQLTCGTSEKEHAIYAVQATLLSIAVTLFVLAIAALVLGYGKNKKIAGMQKASAAQMALQ
jgi:hypothetical protein